MATPTTVQTPAHDGLQPCNLAASVDAYQHMLNEMGRVQQQVQTLMAAHAARTKDPSQHDHATPPTKQEDASNPQEGCTAQQPHPQPCAQALSASMQQHHSPPIAPAAFKAWRTRNVHRKPDALAIIKQRLEQRCQQLQQENGDREALAWIKHLLAFTTTTSAGVLPGVHGTHAIQPCAGKHPSSVCHAAQRPSQRADVALLERWVQTMLQQLAGEGHAGHQGVGGHQAGGGPLCQNNPLELTNTALWIYTVAFEELRRGLAVQCKDRAQLLGALWQQYTGLVETRAGLVQEDALAAAKREAEVARQRVEAMQGKLTAQYEASERKAAQHTLEVDDLRAQCKQLASSIVSLQQELQASQQESQRAQRCLQEETTLRLTAEAQHQAAQQRAVDAGAVLHASQAEVEHQSTLLEAQSKELITLRQQLTLTQTSLDEARTTHLNTTHAHATTQAQLAAAQQQLQALQGTCTTLQQQLSVKETSVGELSVAQGQLHSRLAAAELAAQEQGARARRLEGELEEAQRARDGAARTIAEQHQRITDLRHLADSHQHNHQQALQQVKEGHAAMQRLVGRCEELERVVGEKQVVIHGQQKDAGVALTAVQALGGQLESCSHALLQAGLLSHDILSLVQCTQGVSVAHVGATIPYNTPITTSNNTAPAAVISTTNNDNTNNTHTNSTHNNSTYTSGSVGSTALYDGMSSSSSNVGTSIHVGPSMHDWTTLPAAAQRAARMTQLVGNAIKATVDACQQARRDLTASQQLVQQQAHDLSHTRALLTDTQERLSSALQAQHALQQQHEGQSRELHEAHGKLSAREAEVQRLTDTSSALEHQLIRLQALEPTLLQLQTQHAALQDEYTRTCEEMKQVEQCLARGPLVVIEGDPMAGPPSVSDTPEGVLGGVMAAMKQLQQQQAARTAADKQVDHLQTQVTQLKALSTAQQRRIGMLQVLLGGLDATVMQKKVQLTAELLEIRSALHEAEAKEASTQALLIATQQQLQVVQQQLETQGTQYRTLQQQHDSLLAQATSRRGELLHQALTLVNDTATDLNEEEEGYRGDTGDKGDKMQGGMQKLQEKQKQQLYNVGGTSSSKRLGVDMNDNNNDNDNNKDNKKYSTVMSMGRLDQPTAAITTTQPSRKRVLSFNISSLTTTTNPTTTAHHPPPTDSTTSTTLPPSSSSSTSTLPISQPLTARLRLEHALEERQQQVPRLVSVVRAMDEGQVVVVEQGKQLQGARQEAADAVQRISVLESQLEEAHQAAAVATGACATANSAAAQWQREAQQLQALLHKLQQRYQHLVTAAVGGQHAGEQQDGVETGDGGQYNRDQPLDAIQDHITHLANTTLHQRAAWAQCKANMLAHFCKKLRGALAAEKRARLAAEGEVAATEVALLVQAQQQQRQMLQAVGELRRGTLGTLREALELLHGLRQGALMPVRGDLRGVLTTSRRVAEQLRVRLDQFALQKDQACQAPEGGAEQWAPLVSSLLTRPPPAHLLSRGELVTMCVELYSNSMETQVMAGGHPNTSLLKHESAFTCLMRHIDRGTGGDALWDVTTDPAKQGALATILHGCARHQDDRRIALLSRFLGTPQRHPLPTPAWRFFLSLLQCVREIHNPTRFEAIVREWGASPTGVVITLGSVVDLLGNVYNVDNPASLEVARNHIMPLVQKSRSGYVVDLDSLLQVLLADFLAGNSPRDPLSVPRHLPNASAAIMYNVAASQGPAITNAATPGTGAGGRGSVALLSRPGQLVGSGSRKLPAGGTPSMVG